MSQENSFTALWNTGTSFLTVYKIPLVHSGIGNRNSFPVIQDTHSHSIPDIMPLGSRCGKLWGGVFKGGAEAWSLWDRTQELNRSACLMVPQWIGFDHDTIHEDLNLSRSKRSARGLLREVWDKESWFPWELFQEFICTDTRFKRTCSHCCWDILLSVGFRVETLTMAGVTRKGSGRPSYYYRFLGKSRLQRQRSRSRSRTRPSASRGNKYYYHC